MVSVNRDEYQKLLDSKEKSLSNDSGSDTKTDKVKTYKLTIKDGMSTADVSDILEKKASSPRLKTLTTMSLMPAITKKSALGV